MHRRFQALSAEKKVLKGIRGYVSMTAIDHNDACGSEGSGKATALDGADWLALAAAPTLAIIAVLLWSGRLPSPLGGMVSMYLVMSAFHLAPWLKVIASRRSRIRASGSGARRIERRTNLPHPEQYGSHE
jgi:hypothetical protein